MSTRRSNRVRISKGVVAYTPPITIIDDSVEDEFENHRTCWKHAAALSTPKPTEEELEKLKSSAPCFYDECTRSERSPKKSKCKYLPSKLRSKLDSNTFVDYIEELWKSVSDEKKDSFAYLDCLWFSMYKSDNQRIRSCVFESVKTKQIFSKKYVFLPIVYWSHWTLLILCNFGEDLDSDSGNTCMVFLDSLNTTNSWQLLEPDIRKFVLEIYSIDGRAKDPSLVDDIELFVPKVPQQTNNVECGSFVLYYIQRFIDDAPENFNIEDYPYFMKEDWFSHEDLENFCNKLDSLGAIC